MTGSGGLDMGFRNRASAGVAELPGRGWMGPVVVLALAVVIVAMIGEGILEHADLAAYDPSIGRWFIGERTPVLTRVASDLAVIGGPIGLPVLVVVSVVWLWLRHLRGDAVFVALTMAGSAIISSLMKLAFARPRPASDVIGAISHSYAFPSGHTLNTTAFVGLLTLLALRSLRSTAARATVVAGWLVASLVMAASRVYLADHWFTDVVGGLVTAVGILAVAVLVRRRAQRHHDARTPGPSGTSHQE